VLTLFHGSKSGLVGAIRPTSRACCDFGRGFYMGDFPHQAKTLICRYGSPWFYELEFDVTGLSVGSLADTRQWALFVAYNRGAMRDWENTPLSAQMKVLAEERDVLHGRIADDRVFYAAQRFFDGVITLETLGNVLEALNYGKQYVALTEKACRQIRVKSSCRLTPAECEKLRLESERQRILADDRTAAMLKASRHRNGTYFDEICDRIAAGEEVL